ncbi:thioesterase superfamily protein [Desulfurispirillum indicum S5]|uniref:Thioesterase superfamily protein n=1 Tax=Desulfurispirillum indicum (strain ATCC BAA-1389 / DSM 22839 / S5) TaxID=653733 RepID=E6W5N9_DESIS|nr:acyl-CoA thioesterase [Desulfurispirillum indicum]ADU66070.1 thioesterase superfamily protein [Desulfurispirillum indicum S5]
MPSSTFSIILTVRDYECDFQGIVNNAVYMNYLEHARHEFVKSRGLDVVKLAQENINLVLVKAEIEYRASLRSGDTFRVSVHMEPISRVRFLFVQQIHRQSDGKLIIDACMTGASIDEYGKPKAFDEITALLVRDSCQPDPEA